LRGLYPAPPGVPADIPGMELAERWWPREGSSRYHPGDRVMSLVGGGAQAGLAVVDESVAMPVPAALDWPAAGDSRRSSPPRTTPSSRNASSRVGAPAGDRRGRWGGHGGGADRIAVGARVVASVRQPALRSAVAELGAEVVDPSEAGATAPTMWSSSWWADPASSQPAGDGPRRPDRGDRGRRGRPRRLGPAHADGPARACHGLDPPQPLARGEGPHRAAGRGRAAAARRGGEAPGGRGRGLCPGECPDAYARFQAGGKLGKIVLISCALATGT